MGKPTRALLTSMDQPLGRAVGNAVEVVESIEALKGRGPADLMEVTYALGVHMLLLGRITARSRRRAPAAGDRRSPAAPRWPNSANSWPPRGATRG